MASRYIFSAQSAPRAAHQFTGAASGGTITGASGTVELVFDDTVYAATPEGKARLVNAVEVLLGKIKAARVWPITSAS